jgi:hypothetical protein
MHIASCSKLITAIAMTRTLAAHNLPTSATQSIITDLQAAARTLDLHQFRRAATYVDRILKGANPASTSAGSQ